MKHTTILLAAMLLTGAPAAPPAALAHDRFPAFVYTAPETIREAQGILVALHYLEPDRYKAGEWDRVTERATREFQRDHFLKPSGQLDRDTLAVLSSHASRSTR